MAVYLLTFFYHNQEEFIFLWFFFEKNTWHKKRDVAEKHTISFFLKYIFFNESAHILIIMNAFWMYSYLSIPISLKYVSYIHEKSFSYLFSTKRKIEQMRQPTTVNGKSWNAVNDLLLNRKHLWINIHIK